MFTVDDGGWSIWSEFSVCSTTCGSGIQISTRDCSSPEPIGGGKNCEGEQYKTQTCSNEAECAGLEILFFSSLIVYQMKEIVNTQFHWAS